MRTIQVCVIATTAAVLGSLATLAAQKQIQKSTVFEWAALEAKPTPTGSRRDVLRAPTPTLEELEMAMRHLAAFLEADVPQLISDDRARTLVLTSFGGSRTSSIC